MGARLKLLPIVLLAAFIVGLCPAVAFAAPSNPTSTPRITYSGQVVESIAYRGVTTNAVYTPYRGGLSTDYTYGCFALPRNFYSGVYGISISNLVSSSAVPRASAGYFTETRSPRKGDIVRWNNCVHWGLVKSVSGGTVAIIQQNAWWNSYTCAQVGVTVGASDGSVSFFTYSGYVPDDPDYERIADGNYILRSKIGSRVLDISGASTVTGANAQIYQPNGSAAQIFYIGWDNGWGANYIRNKKSGKFIDAAGGSGAVNVWQYDGNGSAAQHWRFEPAGGGYYYVRNMHGYYLDVNNAENKNGANVKTWTRNQGDAQKWKPIKVSGKAKSSVAAGNYVVRSAIGGKVIDIDSAKMTNGANAQIWDPLDNTAQIFVVGEDKSLGANHVKLKKSGKFLDSAGGDGTVNVQQYTGNGTYAQRWFFEDAGGGYYYIRNMFGYYLDVNNGENKNGANVKTWTFNGCNAQKWKLIRVSGQARAVLPTGTFCVQSKIGGKVLDVSGDGKADGSNVRIWDPTGVETQSFSVAHSSGSDGINNVKLPSSGKFLDSAGGDGVVNVQLYKWNGSKAQNWFFEDTGDGYYYIRNLWGYYLDVYDGKNENGANVQTWTFNGTDAQKWRLVKANSMLLASVGVSAGEYTGEALAQKPVVKLGKTTLRSGTDYTLAYKNNKSVGMATVVVKGKGSYVGSRSVTFKINPKGASLKKLAAASGSFTATWTKQATQTSGYQVQYCACSDFKSGAKTVTVANPKATSKKVAGLAGKAKYYVRVRTYKTVGKANYYSGWSAAKAVTTKAAAKAKAASVSATGKLMASGF